MTSIALIGAAGVVGRSVGHALAARRTPYRVVGRSSDALLRAFGNDPRAERVTWDPAAPASVRAAFAGVDTLVYLVGVDDRRFDEHPVLMRRTIDGATAAGVRRILLIGTVYPYGRVGHDPIRETQPREPHTFKGRMRKAQEDLLMAADAAGRVQGCVLRLPDFYGPGVEASLLHRAAVAAVDGRTADLLGPIDRPHEFVFVPDIGPVVARIVATPAAFGRTWHLAGAGVTTQRALVEEMGRQTGRPVRTRVVGKTMLRVLGCFDGRMREMVEMHYLLSDPVLMDDADLRALLGPLHKTSYREGIRQTLDAVRASRTQPATAST